MSFAMRSKKLLSLVTILFVLLGCASPYSSITRKGARELKRAGFSKAELVKMDSTMTERAKQEEEWDQQVKRWIANTDVKTLPCDTSTIKIDYFSRNKVPPWVNSASDLPHEYGLRLVSYCQKDDGYHTFSILSYSCRVWYTDTIGEWRGIAFTERRPKPNSFIRNMPKDMDEDKPIRITFLNLLVQDSSMKTVRLRRRWVIG